MRRILTGLLSAALIITSAPAGVYAAEENIYSHNDVISADTDLLSYEDTEDGLVTEPVEPADITDDPDNDTLSSDSILSGCVSSDSISSDIIPEPLPPEEPGESDFSEDPMMGEMPENDPITVENPSRRLTHYYINGYGPLRETTLPKKYRTEDLPELRAQNPYASCWAFSSMALAEINMIHSGIISAEEASSLDLSELQLIYFSYNFVTDPLGGTLGDNNELKSSPGDTRNVLTRGGNRNFSKNVLAGWIGAADEADAPYTTSSISNVLNYGLNDSLAYRDSAHMTGYRDVNVSTTDVDAQTKTFDENGIQAVKQLVYDLGAAGISYHAENATSAVANNLYDSEHNSYFDPNIRTTNHAVTVVGWDDDFPRENFKGSVKPQGDGAWLIRNSWQAGGNFDNSQQYAGYFWLSYYSMSNGDSVNAFVFDKGDDYAHNYQYDGSMDSSLFALSTANWVRGANVFTAHGSQNGDILRAVSFATASADTDYEIRIYRNISEDDPTPTGGELAGQLTGSTTYAGFYTVTLDEPLELEYGEKFAVDVKLSKAGDQPILLCDRTTRNASWYSTTATVNSGESFWFSGSKWNDMKADATKSFGNFRIKAFTDDGHDRVRITKAPKAIRNLTYTGEPLELITAGTASGGSMLYRAGDDEFSDSIPTRINAGTYTVDYKAVADAEHRGTEEGSLNVTISKGNYPYSTVPANVTVHDEPDADFLTFTGTEGLLYEYSLDQGFSWNTLEEKETGTGYTVSGGVLNGIIYVGNNEYRTGVIQIRAHESANYKPGVPARNPSPFTCHFEADEVGVEISDDTKSGDFYTYTYTGKKIKPHIRAYCNGRLLREGTDYTVTYKNNVKAYTPASAATINTKKDPYVKVTFKGSYKGSRKLQFAIAKASFADLFAEGKITVRPASATVKTGKGGAYKVQKLKPTICYGNRMLKEGTDYKLRYNDPRSGAYAAPSDSTDPWQITVVPKDVNYTDSFTADEYLYDVSGSVSLSSKHVKVNVAISTMYDVYSAGQNRCLPVYSLTYNGTLLKEDLHYKVTPVNAAGKGKAYLIFTAIPGSGFTGSVKKSYKIDSTDLSFRAVMSVKTDADGSVAYVKGGCRPSVTVTLYNGYILKEGTDYKVSYGNNKKVKSASSKNAPYVRVTGKGNYKGKLTCKFSIVQQDINSIITGENPLLISDVKYSKTKNAYRKAKVVIKDANGRLLKQGSDFNIVNFTTSDGSSKPAAGSTVTVTVTGMNNYKGSIADVTYKIQPAGIEKAKLAFYEDAAFTVKKTSFTYTGKEIKPGTDGFCYPRLTLKDKKNTVTLTRGEDYDIVGYYNNIKKGYGYVIIRGRGSYAGIKIFKFKISARKI